MAEFEIIYESRNFMEFDFVADILDEAGIEFFTQETGDIFSAQALQQMLVRAADIAPAARQIARAVLAQEKPAERFDFDEDLARGLRELRDQDRAKIEELDAEASSLLVTRLLGHFTGFLR